MLILCFHKKDVCDILKRITTKVRPLYNGKGKMITNFSYLKDNMEFETHLSSIHNTCRRNQSLEDLINLSYNPAREVEFL